MAHFNQAQWERLSRLAKERHNASQFRKQPHGQQDIQYDGDWSDEDIKARAAQAGVEVEIEAPNGLDRSRHITVSGGEKNVAAFMYIIMSPRKFVATARQKREAAQPQFVNVNHVSPNCPAWGQKVELTGRPEDMKCLECGGLGIANQHNNIVIDHRGPDPEDEIEYADVSQMCDDGHHARCRGNACGCQCHKRKKAKAGPDDKPGNNDEKKMKCPVCGKMVWPDHTPNGPTCQRNQGL
jgi:hypothetical protein